MPAKQTAEEAHRRRDEIIAAATSVFLRYGHARTTMNDLAVAAGISRPALYLVFPGKENLFAAVINRLIDEELTKYKAALPLLKRLDRQLHFCCEQWAGHGYDLTQAHPDARDVFNLAFPPVRSMYERLIEFLADLLRDAVKEAQLKSTPKDVACVLIFAMRGVKDIALDAEHMRRLIALQVDAVLALVKYQ